MGQWSKGQSGNPAGRPPKAVEDAQHSLLLELFDDKAERAVIESMLTIAKRSHAMNATAAIQAATWLWDRKYGKVKDRVESDGELVIRVERVKRDSPTS